MTNEVLLGQSIHHPSTLDFRYEREIAESPVHPSSLKLLTYWQECEVRGGMRMGRDMPARCLAKILSGLAVTEPIDDWHNGYIRLAGMIYTTRFGRDITGMTIREIYQNDPAGGEALLAGARNCARNWRTTTLRTRVLDGPVELMAFEILIVPLRAPNGRDAWVLTGTFRR